MSVPGRADGEDGVAPATAAAQRPLEIPLFPLGVVLFPGGLLSLKVFEQRYLDMAAACIRTESPFGVCLIASGNEVGQAAEPHAIGTLAHIVDVDMPQLGIMLLEVRGGHRFRIEKQTLAVGGLWRAQVSLLDEATVQPVPPALETLRSLLQKVASQLGPARVPEPQAFDDAAWVGYRLSEVLPLQPLARQKLLELQDPVLRLQALAVWLSQGRKIFHQQ